MLVVMLAAVAGILVLDVTYLSISWRDVGSCAMLVVMLAAVAGMLVPPHSNRHLGSHRSHNSAAAAVPILR